MGLIKTFFSIIKTLHQNKKILNKFKTMNNEQLLTLDDDELYEGMASIFFHCIDESDIDRLNTAQKTISTIMLFDSEVQNGGLCQFFVNSSRAWAPYVSESLKAVQAYKTESLFNDFIHNNKIDVSHLESFIITDVSEFAIQNERYPFDDFDTSYYTLEEDLTELLLTFIRKNINDIIIQ